MDPESKAELAFPVAAFIETLLYGVYTCLFFMAMDVMTSRKASGRTTSARASLCFLAPRPRLFTTSSAFTLYRFFRAFILHVDPRGPRYYLLDITRWDATADSILICVMTWLGDALVIYRCYFVWNRNLLIIALPTLLLLAAAAINIYCLVWFEDPTIADPLSMWPWLDAIFPLALAQNVLTTGLLLLKIWLQHRASSVSGVIDRSSRLSLVRILRIIVESAMIYTIQIMILTILYFRKEGHQIIVQLAIIPSIGIVFVLIAVRVHLAKQSTTAIDTNHETMPVWASVTNDSVIELSQSRIGVSFRVSAEKINKDDDDPSASSSSSSRRKKTHSLSGGARIDVSMGMTPEVALTVSVWVEAVIYGGETLPLHLLNLELPPNRDLCVSILRGAVRHAQEAVDKRRLGQGQRLIDIHAFLAQRYDDWTNDHAVHWQVFLIGTTLMFLLATAHMVVNLYRFIRGFVLNLDPLGPYFYFFDFTRWDVRAHSVMLCLMTWLGDALVIYRCYVVWDRKLWVTVVPLILLLLSICSNAALLYWFIHPHVVSHNTVLAWIGTVYPVAFAQNTITTGMIAFKIWKQHRASRTMGVVNSSSLDLLSVLRIIIESAMIYTIQLLVLIILFPLHHNAQFIVQDAVIPSIGIVFVLIAVRVHFSKSRTLFTAAATVLAPLPSWPDDDSSTQEDGRATPRRSIVVQMADNLAIAGPAKKSVDFMSSRQTVSAPC
ncbi:hypothetical protein NLJ89_g6752 [Agrocybe chaxingu]|uniref:Uncharacterized protein n=1 Tax=Agrocybe chaxingu TaxID=84603 RepID=A0A9W8K092_9AGAR|nr:hypothetical protein NLJ89_g6752 [Agrocybe chaxingu]